MKNKKFVLILIAFYSLLSNTLLSQKNDLQITYIGNMGVCLEYQNQQILIDALHVPYRSSYLAPSPDLLRSLTEGKLPYNRIKYSLTTHYHGDHMHAGAIEKFLQSNDERKLLGPPQVVDKVLTMDSSLRTNCIASTKDHEVFRDGTLNIESFKIPHASPKRHGQVENVAFLIHWPDLSILHVGDMQDDLSTIKRFPQSLKVDVAIVPNWILMTTETKTWILNSLTPDLVIATHISPLDIETSIQMIKKSFPGAHCFTKSKETLIFTPDQN